MQEYFEGQIEYLVTKKDTHSNYRFLETHYFLGKRYRKEYNHEYLPQIEIWNLDELYVIYPKTKRIAACGDHFLVDPKILKISETEEKEIILNFHCQKMEIDINYKHSNDKANYTVFISKDIQLHPVINDKDVPFCFNYLPLKIEGFCSISGKTIKVAQKIKFEKPSSDLFNVMLFESLGFKRYSYDEQAELDNIEYEKQKQESEEELKRLEEERKKTENIEKEKKWAIVVNQTMIKLVKKNKIEIPIEIQKDPSLITQFVLDMEEEIKQKILSKLLDYLPERE